MTLLEWLKKEHKRVADMARDMELSHPVVLRWSNGSRIPSPIQTAKFNRTTFMKLSRKAKYY